MNAQKEREKEDMIEKGEITAEKEEGAASSEEMKVR